MLKFIKHNMDTIDGIAAYPTTSFVIFFVFFVLLTVYVLIQSKDHYKEMSEMPLEDQKVINHNNVSES